MSNSPTKSQQAVTKPKKKVYRSSRTTALLIIGWLAVLVLVGFIAFTVSRNSALAPNKVAEKALVDLKTNDSKALYQLGSPDFKKGSSEQKVQGVVADWTKVINQATDAKPTLISKQDFIQANKQLTHLTYRYGVKPGKSKIGQKDLYVNITLEHTNGQYLLYTFALDTK